MPNKISRNEFISRSERLHNNKYDYSIVEYKNYYTKVKIICPSHGVFEQTPNNHLNSHSCKKCSIDLVTSVQRKDIEFIKKSIIKYGNKYDYSKVEYINRISKVIIICPIHGEFESTPINHLSRNGCTKCSKAVIRQKNLINFIERSSIIHNYKYDYSMVNYVSDKIKVKIICNEHGLFIQQPNTHVNGVGCPSCSISKGESRILNYLKLNGIKFEQEKKFKNCSNIKDLSFDFYLPDINICIEFDGRQHFEPIDFFGGKESLDKSIHRDSLKSIFCINNNINLLRIPYYDYNKIEKILDGIWEN